MKTFKKKFICTQYKIFIYYYFQVHFPSNDKIAEVHQMITWSHAYKEARKGPWRQYARDHERFQRRIEDLENILAPVLLPKHRNQIYKTLTDS